MSWQRSHRLHAARVAVVATAVVVACYVGCAVALTLFVSHRLTAEADTRLSAQLADVGRLAPSSSAALTAQPPASRGGDLDDVPIFVWEVGSTGSVQPLNAGAPALPRLNWSTTPVTADAGGVAFRFHAERSGAGWVVAGQSVAEIARVRSTLVLPEVAFGALLAVATFIGALVVGLRASAPLDLIRRRQAEFTADASHELRTPLSVMEAEVDLALRRRRRPEEYEEVLWRIASEGRRLRRIVDDLMWLARADNQSPGYSEDERVDVAAVVAACTDRFGAVAESKGVALSYRHGGPPTGRIQAPSEWIDRLAGVLIDNACKYAGRGGTAVVSVVVSGSRVGLRVEDSGPGIPEVDRAVIFDRFHRATSEASGSGLGLAIADSVVRMTGGTWSVGEAPLGGARMEVTWRRVADRNERSVSRVDAGRSAADRRGGVEAVASGEDSVRIPN